MNSQFSISYRSRICKGTTKHNRRNEKLIMEAVTSMFGKKQAVEQD
jgi:hypothetical protein